VRRCADAPAHSAAALPPVPGRSYRVIAMKPLFRPSIAVSRAARLWRPTLGVLLVSSAFGAQAQQWTRGEAVWNANSCSGCHVGVRSLDSMRARLQTQQAARQLADAAVDPGMRAVWQTLGNAQKDDVSAFVANIRAEPNIAITSGNVSMSVAAVGQASQATLTLFNLGRGPLQISVNGGQTVSGDTSQFRLQNVGAGCDAQTINAGQSCQIVVFYQPTVAPAAQHSYTVRFAHNGEPTSSTQITLTGRIAAAPGPAPAPSPAPAPAPAPSSGGGGALPLALWAALLPAALLARRRRT
jgi:hypothetical protein